MRMTLIDAILYPKFRKYLKDDMPEVAKVDSIRRAFKRFGQLHRASLERALKWGEDPLVDVTQLTGAYGEFTPGIGSNTIRIDKDLVKRFENGTDWVNNKWGKRVHLVGATVLHEMVHWADDKDGIDFPGEEGEKFEKAVYGQVLG